jgi:hypothetical protein
MVTVTTSTTERMVGSEGKGKEERREKERGRKGERENKTYKSRGVPLTLPPLLRCLDPRYLWEVVLLNLPPPRPTVS